MSSFHIFCVLWLLSFAFLRSKIWWNMTYILFSHVFIFLYWYLLFNVNCNIWLSSLCTVIMYSSQLLKWIKCFCQDISKTSRYFTKIQFEVLTWCLGKVSAEYCHASLILKDTRHFWWSTSSLFKTNKSCETFTTDQYNPALWHHCVVWCLNGNKHLTLRRLRCLALSNSLRWKRSRSTLVF